MKRFLVRRHPLQSFRIAEDVLIAHAHTSLSLPAVEVISLDPILFTQVPNLDTMFAKLTGFVDGVTSWTGAVSQAQVKQTLSKTVLPFLKASTATPPAQQSRSTTFDHWPALTSSLAANLKLSELFPLVDVWRIALLNASFAAWNATKKVQEGPLQLFVDKALQAEDAPRNYLLTVLRMLSNTFSNQVLVREMILFARGGVTKVLVDAVLHDDASVRTAAASLAFNIAAYLQKLRIDKVKARDDGKGAEEDEEWELEIVVAVLGAIERETSSEETGEHVFVGRCRVVYGLMRDSCSAPIGGVSWVAVAVVSVYGTGDVVVGDAERARGIEGEAGKGGMWGGWSCEEGGTQADFGGGGQALPYLVLTNVLLYLHHTQLHAPRPTFLSTACPVLRNQTLFEHYDDMAGRHPRRWPTFNIVTQVSRELSRTNFKSSTLI